MKVYDEIKACNDTVVALGYFDGVHLGHAAVIKAAVRCAAEYGYNSAVLTFRQSPSSVIYGIEKQTITPNSTKALLMEEMGVDSLFLAQFEDYMNMSARDFVFDILHKKLGARAVFCGFNYHFGKGGQADSENLKQLCAEYGINVEVVPPVYYDTETISSTRIRKCLESGQVCAANEMLGRFYTIDSEVAHGNKMGNKLGFPTLNQNLANDCVKPLFGVYASVYTYEGVSLPGVTNIGVKPTFGLNAPVAETWVPGVDTGDMYGKRICVSLVEFIRKEQKFDSMQALKSAVYADRDSSMKVLEEKFGNVRNIKL